MNYRRFVAVARKEFLHILRDPRSLVMALALPAVMLMLFGWALTLDVDRIPVVILDQDQTPASREVVAAFAGSRYFTVVETASDYRQIESLIDRGTCLAGLVIPRNFAQDVLSGRTGEVQFILDGSDSNTASIALSYARVIADRLSASLLLREAQRKLGRTPPNPVDLRSRVWYNSTLQSKNYIVPGLIAVILMIIASLLTSLTVAREWETGTMEQLLSTPVRPIELVLGKMSAYFSLGAVDTLLAIVLSVTVFGIPLRGDLVLLAISCFIFLTGAMFWGIFLSASVKTQLLAYQLGMLSSFLPAFLLSGFMFAIENMPIPVQVVTYLVPARYFIEILRGIFLKDVGLSVLGGELALLFLFGVIVMFLAARKVGRKIA